MTRAHLLRPLQDSMGNLVLDASVRVLTPGTETPIGTPMFTDLTGNTFLGNPITVSDGLLSIYMEESSVIRLGITRTGFAEVFMENVVVPSATIRVEETFSFGQQGTLAASTGVIRFYIDEDCTISRVRASLGVAGGGEVIFDVLVNGVSIYHTTPANRPTLEAGQHTALGGVPDTVSLVAGDYLTVDVLSPGAGDAEGFSVQLRVSLDT